MLVNRRFAFVDATDGPVRAFELRALRDAAVNTVGLAVADAGIIRSLVRDGYMYSPEYHSAGKLAIGYITYRGRQRDAYCACEPIAPQLSNQDYARRLNTVAMEVLDRLEKVPQPE